MHRFRSGAAEPTISHSTARQPHESLQNRKRTSRGRSIGLLLLALIMAGCAPSYLPGINGSSYPNGAPLALQERRQYIGADVSRGEGYFEGESSFLARAHYTAARGGEKWRGSYGGFAYGGSYDLDASFDSASSGPQSFFGAGSFIDLSASLPLGGAHVGAGLHGGLSLVELGGYPQFRKDLGDNVAMYLAPHSAIYVFTQYDLAPESSISLQLLYGVSGFATATALFHSGDLGFTMSAWSLVQKDSAMQNLRPGFSAGVSYRIE